MHKKKKRLNNFAKNHFLQYFLPHNSPYRTVRYFYLTQTTAFIRLNKTFLIFAPLSYGNCLQADANAEFANGEPVRFATRVDPASVKTAKIMTKNVSLTIFFVIYLFRFQYIFICGYNKYLIVQLYLEF